MGVARRHAVRQRAVDARDRQGAEERLRLRLRPLVEQVANDVARVGLVVVGEPGSVVEGDLGAALLGEADDRTRSAAGRAAPDALGQDLGEVVVRRLARELGYAIHGKRLHARELGGSRVRPAARG